MTNKTIFTLPEKLTEIAEKFPNKTALQIKTSEGYKTYTYPELYKNSLSIAQSLIGLGIKKGDRVAIVLENRPEWSFIYFGILFARGVAVPLDPQSTSDDLKYFFTDSASKIIFTSQQFKNTVCESNQSAKIILLDDEKDSSETISFSNLLNNNQSLKIIENQPENIASILYTSGTTGKPKGVMLTHKNFYSNFQSVEKLKIFSHEHNFLSILPLHHSFPFMATLIIPLFSGNKITYVSSLKREEITKCMQETGVTILVGVPQFFYLFYHAITDKIKQTSFFLRITLLGLVNTFYKLHQLTNINLNKFLLTKIHSVFGKHLKYFICGGAAFDKNIELFFSKIGFTLVQGYGLTETSPIVTFNPPEKIKIGSAGKTIANVEIKIINPDKNGIGEVAISGPNVMKGYYKHEKETAEALKDGWFYSGDLGYIDKKNYLFLTGRKKEIIVLGSGKNISPQEVETHYLKSKYIKDLCVLSADKGEKEKLVAVIVPDFEHFKKTGEINIDEIIKLEIDILSRNYPLYKRIMGFVTIKEELPKTRLGKLKRFTIKDIYLKKLDGVEIKKDKKEENIEMISSPHYKIITKTIEQTKELKGPLHLDDHLGMDLGFDSLERIELISILEKKLNIDMPEKLIAEIFTLKELTETVDRLTKEQHSKPIQTTTIQNENIWQNILKKELEKNIANKIDISPTWFAKIWNKTIYNSLYLVARLLWRIEIYGKDNLPKDKPFVICPNHVSLLDGFLIGASLPSELKQSIFFLGYHIYFDIPVIRHLIKTWKIIPLDPANNLIDAMQACSFVLRNNKSICIFPEGNRSPDGSLQPFKKGVGILAEELNIPLLPVYIDGAFEALPRGNTWPKFNKIKIIFGKPFSPYDLKQKAYKMEAKDNYEAIIKGLQKEMDNLAINYKK